MNSTTVETLDGGSISQRLVFAIFGVALVCELFAFGFAGYLTHNIEPSWWVLFMLLPSFGGIFLTKSDSATVSLMGGLMCAAGLGAVSGPEMGHYKVGSIVNVAAYTAFIAMCMTAAAVIFKNFFAAIGGALFGALCLLLGANIVTIFLAMFGVNVAPALTFFDCIAVVLFSLYIGYDMRLLQDGPSTADHAVDVSVGVFLDIINIFMALLRLVGEKDD